MTLTRRGLAVVLVVCAMVAPAGLAAAEGVYEADANHDLATRQAIEQYHETGNVTGDVTGLDMHLTVADTAAGVGLSDLARRSTGIVFLRVDYDEELARTVRFYLPAAYVEPQLKQGLQSVEGDLTVDLKPVENRSYTAITIEFEGETSAVFPISVSRGAIADGKSGISDIFSNVTGFQLPSLTSGGAEWHYISSVELDDSTDDYINSSNATTIQYNAAPTRTEPDWVPVQPCDGGDEPVCTYSKADYPNRTYLMSTQADPPRVRYRVGRSVVGSIETAINDAMRGVENLVEDIAGLFGAGDSNGGDQ